MTPRPVALVFLDGVGIGSPDPDQNPFLRADLPTLEGALGTLPTLEGPTPMGPAGRCYALDARLEVEGLPQSGTGQTALFTGTNAADRFGRHFGPWVPVSLRPFLDEHNLLRRAAAAGRSVAFANAYPEGFLERYPKRTAAPPLVAHSAGAFTRHAEALREGDAVASEIVNTGWRNRLGHLELPVIGAEEAGENLGRIASGHDLTLYAHYTTDHVGHRAGMGGCVEALERVDAFLRGALRAAPEVDFVVASDHGNIEDIEAEHTLNPALGLWFGRNAPHELTSIMDVAPAILAHLGVD